MTSGHVKLSGKTKDSNDIRLINFRDWLQDNAQDVNIIAYEAVRTMRSAAAVVCLSELQGVLKLHAMEHNITMVPYSAGTIKKHCTGSGAAKKPDIVAAVNQRHGLSITDDNEADAVAILDLYLHDAGAVAGA